MGTTKEDESSINIVLLRNNINSSCNWLEGGSIYGVSMKKTSNESFGLQSYKVNNSTQDNLKWFEISIIIGIVGFDIIFHAWCSWNIFCKIMHVWAMFVGIGWKFVSFAFIDGL